MRLLEQPGPVWHPRALVKWGELAGSYRVTLAPGTDFLDGLVEVLAARRVRFAGALLLGGTVRSLSFMTGRPLKPDEKLRRVATHNGPHEIACPATILAGNAILGEDTKGEALVHCHAVFADAEGKVIGGHLMRGECIAGETGIRLHVSALSEVGFRAVHDSETNFEIFQPAKL